MYKIIFFDKFYITIHIFLLKLSIISCNKMDVIIVPLIGLIVNFLSLLMWFMVISISISWLVFFNILNPYNRLIQFILDFYERLFTPILLPIRNILPNLGGIDISPLILIFVISFVQNVLERILLKFI